MFSKNILCLPKQLSQSPFILQCNRGLLQVRESKFSFSSANTFNSGSRHCMYQNLPYTRNHSHMCRTPTFCKIRASTPVLSKRRNFSSFAWVIVIKPIAMFMAAVAGRRARIWYNSLSPEKKNALKTTVRKNWRASVFVVTSLIISVICYTGLHIEETPYTGRKRYCCFTKNRNIFDQQANDFNLKEIFCYFFFIYEQKDPKTKLVRDVARKLIAANPELKAIGKWNVYVVKHAVLNACVLPNGYIFVSDSLLDVANTPDQLAIILGHEMAHVLLQHDIERLSLISYVGNIAGICIALVWALAPTYTRALALLFLMCTEVTVNGHSRLIEEEADKVGLILASRACFDFREGRHFWRKMAEIKKNQHVYIPVWLRTHPHSLKRAEFIESMENQAKEWREETKRCPALLEIHSKPLPSNRK